MDYAILLSFAAYFICVIVIGLFALRKSKANADFNLANRSINYWVTGISAHASDMSQWLFMAYPAMIYTQGLMGCWTAIGLSVFMFLNWQFVAPGLRTATEKYNSLTLSSFFEKRFSDRSGTILYLSAFFTLLFFTFYISANLVGLGRLFNSVLGIDYFIGITLGVIVVFYTLLGGYLSMVWIDFFQGLFLMGVIIAIPLIALWSIGSFEAVVQAASRNNIPLSLIPSFSLTTIRDIIFAVAGWGLGYFGQPHILTKFMAIDDVREMKKAQYIGLSWMALSMIGATLVGLVGIASFTQGTLASNELIFVTMVKSFFSPFIGGFILCAVIAAAINVIGAQILCSASIIAEDFYKKIIVKNDMQPSAAQQKHITVVSRLGVVVMCILAYIFAFSNTQPLNDLVFYAWTGLGSSFGPLLLVALHSRVQSAAAAVAGILTGGLTAALWPYLATSVPAMIPAYIFSLTAIFVAEFLWKKMTLQEIVEAARTRS